MAVVEIELVIGITVDGPATFVEHAVAVPPANQHPVVEIGGSVVADPLIEVVRFAMRRIGPAAGTAAVGVPNDQGPELIGRERAGRPTQRERYTVLDQNLLRERITHQAPRRLRRDAVPACQAAFADREPVTSRPLGDEEDVRQVCAPARASAFEIAPANVDQRVGPLLTGRTRVILGVTAVEGGVERSFDDLGAEHVERPVDERHAVQRP